MISIRSAFFLLISLSLALNSPTISRAEESNLDPLNGASEANDSDQKDQVEVDPLREKAKLAIEISKRRYLDGSLHTPWQILHGMLALRGDYQIKIGGEKTSALEWMQKGQTYDRKPWVKKSAYGGHFHTFTQPYHFEGHPNQFLAILTMSNLPADTEFMAWQNQTAVPVTIQQMVEHAKMVVCDHEEQTWTLWALSKYLPSDAEWINKDGESWGIERLVLKQSASKLEQGGLRWNTRLVCSLTCTQKSFGR